MSEKSITFLSNRGAGLNSDMNLLEKNLVNMMDQDRFSSRFFLKNERRKNPMARQGIERAKIEFCRELSDVVCADASLAKGMKFQEGVRILLASPYDYQFKNAMLLKRKGRKGTGWKTFRRFTHVVPGCPFTAQLMRNGYYMERTELLEDICLPFVWEINHPERQGEMRKEIGFYFPAVGEKKVLALLLNREKESRRNFLKSFDLKAFLNHLGEEWFVLTNVEELMEDSYTLSAKYRTSFGYVKRIMPEQDILYVADAMVTNNGRYASYFASRHKPLYCLKYRGSHFEKYMKATHPAMYLSNFGELMQADFSGEGVPERQKEFDRLFAYPELKCPYDAIGALLRQNY